MAALIGIGSVVVLFILAYLYYSIKEKVNRNIVSADRYEKQKTFTHQVMIIETTSDYQNIFNSLSGVFPQNISVGQAFKGGHYKLLHKLGNKITYEHTESIGAYAGGDYFEGSISFYKKSENIIAIVQIERWRTSSGVARNTGINAMEDFYNKVKSAFLNADANALVKYSGVDASVSIDGLTSLDISAVKANNAAQKFCSNCGTKNVDSAKFCSKCGNKF